MPPLRRLGLLGLLASLLLVPPAASQDMPFDQPPDLVEGLVVKARTPGPAWWKVSDADTTVWILGSPGLLPESVKWDDSALKRRLTNANRLIMPPREEASLLGTLGMAIGKTLVDRPLAGRLPPDLLERLKDRLDRDAPYITLSGQFDGFVEVEEVRRGGRVGIQTEFWSSKPYVVIQASKLPSFSPSPDLYSVEAPPKTIILALAVLKLADAPLGRLVDEPASRAEDLATGLKTPLVRAGTLDTLAAFRIRAALPEASQQACLAGALDVLDAKEVRVAATRAAAQAWAEGDVPAALGRKNRFDMLGACATPPAAKTMAARNITAAVSAIRTELRKRGHAVAVVDLTDLLQVGGVLDQLRKVKGVTVTAPDRLDE